EESENREEKKPRDVFNPSRCREARTGCAVLQEALSRSSCRARGREMPSKDAMETLSQRQFFCALRGLDHGLDKRDAQFAFLEFHDRVDRTSGRGCDCVF